MVLNTLLKDVPSKGNPMGTPVKTLDPKDFEVPIYIKMEVAYSGDLVNHSWTVSVRFDFRNKKRDNL